jgi:tyrosine-protein kinase Etk/Wzc
MDIDNLQESGLIKRNVKTSGLNMKEILSKFIYHWPLFIAFILISLGINYLYLKYSKPVYEIQARLLINNNDQSLNSESILKENDTSEFDNELLKSQIEMFKSSANVMQVVKTLNLDVEYTLLDKFKNKELYKDCPFEFILRSPRDSQSRAKILITIIDQNSFLFKQGSSQKTYRYNTSYTGGIGKWKVVKNANLNEYKGKTIKVDVKDQREVVSRIVEKVTVTKISNTTPIVMITFKDKVLNRGIEIVNTLITQYNESSKVARNHSARSALILINKQLSSLTGDMDNSARRLRILSYYNKYLNKSPVIRAYVSSLKNNDASLNETDRQLLRLNNLHRSLNAESIDLSNPPSMEGISQPVMQSLVTKLIDLQKQYQYLASALTTEDPAFDRLTQEIKDLKTKLNPIVNNYKSSLLAKRRAYVERNSKLQRAIKTLSTQERQFIESQRFQINKQNLYAFLMQKREEAGLILASKEPFSRVVDSAYLDHVVQRGSYLLAGLFGILLAAVLIFLKKLLYKKVSKASEIRQNGIPVTAELNYEYTSSPIVFHPGSRLAISDHLRALRTNFMDSLGDLKTGRVTVVTSSMTGEGKTFITSNLAVSLAALGRKTVLLELDFQKPVIAKIFKVDQQIGISDYLWKRASIKEIIKTSFNQNLSLITAGTVADSPVESFIEDKLDDLIALLKTEYDDILIDGPSMNSKYDPTSLSRFSDATFYIVRENFTRIEGLKTLVTTFDEQKLPKLKVVFNGVRDSKAYKNVHTYYALKYEPEKMNTKIFFKKLSNRLFLADN